MPSAGSRRQFLQAAAGAAVISWADWQALTQLPPVSAADARAQPAVVRLQPEIEPLVRFLEEMPRDKLVAETIRRIQRGLSYQELLAALFLAGVRNVEPRPSVGFKFHAVLVVNAAHLASLAAPDRERWLPILWAVDHFKGAQAQNVSERNGWRMGPVDEAAVPAAEQARQAFITAMETWDVAAADVAVAGLVRTHGADEVWELFSRYAPRDFRSIGHKAIFLANSRRTLACIGWQHAEPVLRSLAYAMLAHDGQNPARAELAADRAGRENLRLAENLKPGWRSGRIDAGATAEYLATLRQTSDLEASQACVDLLQRQISPQSVWDALLCGASEVLLQHPGIVGLHAVTTANALRYLYENTADDTNRRWILLQCAAFVPAFRAAALARGGATHTALVDKLEPLALQHETDAVAEICGEISRDRMTAARKVLAYLQTQSDPKPLLDAARLLVFSKGNDAHDYKFSAAVLEDVYHLSPPWRASYLAASVFNLTGSGSPDNALMQQARAALAAG
ncbi:MAG: hypothetical protein JSS02_29975 [Planctomycetes bacterium]|nr:hypothetical protein [Planctomycetota bacterium]